MLIKLERDRLKTRAQIQREMSQNVHSSASVDNKNLETQSINTNTLKNTKTKWTPFPSDERANPFA
jgi:hypothetical protein